MEHESRRAREFPSANADHPAKLMVAPADALVAAEQRAQDAERRLRQLQHRYQSLTGMLAEWTWTATHDGVVDDETPVGRGFTGQTADGIRGFGWAEAVHPDDRAGALNAWTHAVATQTPYEHVQRVRRADGEYRTMLVRGQPVFDDEDRVTEWVGATIDITERLHTEAQLARQARMLERTHNAIFLWELGGAIVYWNHGAELLYGYPAEQARGRISHELLQTLFPVADSYAFEGLLAREGEWTGELIHTTRDDRHVTVLSRHQLLREPDGRTYVLETSRDITDRKRLEREVMEQANQLRATFETIADAVFVYDTAGRAMQVNAAGRKLLALDALPSANGAGHVAQELGPQLELRGADGQPLVEEQWPLSRALKGEILTGADAVDVAFRALDGREARGSTSAAPIRDAQGEITGAVLVIRDVTDRSQLERRTQEVLTAMIAVARIVVEPDAPSDGTNGTPDQLAQRTKVVARRLAELTCSVLACRRVGIMVIEPETRLQRPLAVVGLSAELEAQWWVEQEANPVPYGQGAEQAFLARFEAGEALVLDMTEPPYSELPNPYQITTVAVAPMRIASDLIGILSLDYAGERHRFTQEELALAEAVAQLAALTIERERLLHEREEAQANELALREINQRMNTFLAIAGHELRTPVTSMKANVQLASRAVRPLRTLGIEDAAIAKVQRALDVLDVADRQISRLDRLIEDLLDVTRIQAQTLELDQAPADLADVVREAVAQQQLAWPGRTLSTKLPGGPVLLEIDARRIAQVVTNYVTNALKYSPPTAPVRVTVTVTGTQVRVAVRDEGPGLSAQQQKQLWELFHRVEGIRQMSGSGEGLGIGLYICATIIRAHGGQVGVDSKVGTGSTFWFTLLSATQKERRA
jgi:PAS domain S-box-containing protein